MAARARVVGNKVRGRPLPQAITTTEQRSHRFTNVAQQNLLIICIADLVPAPIRGESKSIDHTLKRTPLWYTSALLCE